MARRPEGTFGTRGGSDDSKARRESGVMTRSLGPSTCSSNEPTWTDERVELLKSRFAAGLSCREIADDIGVSRNAVIGKLSRLNLTREKSGDARRPARKDAAKRTPPGIGAKAPIPDAPEIVRRAGACGRRADPQRTLLLVARVERGRDAAGRSAPRAPRISVFAATRRSKACPIAPATAGSPTGRALASASRGGEPVSRPKLGIPAIRHP